MEYIIRDERGNDIFLEIEVVTVQGRISFIKKFKIPKDIPPGRYILYVRATHDEGVGSSTVWFNFLEEEEKPPIGFRNMLIITLITIFIVFLIVILIREKRKRHQEELLIFNN